MNNLKKKQLKDNKKIKRIQLLYYCRDCLEVEQCKILCMREKRRYAEYYIQRTALIEELLTVAKIPDLPEAEQEEILMQ